MVLTATRLPKLLRETPCPPDLLYVAGSADSLHLPSVAVVGSRAITPYGAAACRAIVAGCVRAGLAIVSGLATGIDAVAHDTALAHRGVTIAVLGSGLDPAVMFPAAHRSLAQRIITQGGAVVSEYPANTVARRHHFIARNRILAGLSLATIVVEAAERSGAINTAHHALEANRPVFAVPGSIFSSRSRGTHQLIQQGANIFQSVEQLLAELQFTLPTLLPSQTQPLNATQQHILSCLETGPKHAEALMRTEQFAPQLIQASLTELEIQGIVRKNIWMLYEISHR